MDRNEVLKKLPLDLTWRQAARLQKPSNKPEPSDTPEEALSNSDPEIWNANKPEPSDTPEEALSDSDPEIWNANIKTLSKLPSPEELAAMNAEQLEDARAAAYQDSLTYAQEAWGIPGRIAEDARRKKQYYNSRGQEEGYSEEDDPERSTSDAGNPDQKRDCYKQYEDELTSAWHIGKK